MKSSGPRRLLLPALQLLAVLSCPAQPKNPAPPTPMLQPAEGERQARALVANLLSQKPAENYTNVQVLKIRGADKQWRETAVKFEAICTPTNYLNVYEAVPATGPRRGTRLTIVHTDDQPNEYLLAETGDAPRKLAPGELMTPFAGSDFWVGDLGLDFLHWPQQRLMKKELRKGQSCVVLESKNPHPAPGAYSRVVSWLATNSSPDAIVVIHADGYDQRDEWLKEFDPKDVEKVNGAWRLQEMEMRNRLTGSRSRIEFKN